MKKNIFFGFVFLLLSGQTLAQTSDESVAHDEVARAQYVLEQHLYSCDNGSAGWWLKLDSPFFYRYQSGGISTNNGAYYGCGTCEECRAKLNSDIDGVLNYLTRYCSERGGEVKNQNRGDWTEDIQNEKWTVSVRNVGVTCEKWIPCGR